MDIDALIELARNRKAPAVVVLVGAERFLVERAVTLLRAAAVEGGIPGFNDDVFHGRGLAAGTVSATVRTLPMMAQTRFVLVRETDEIAAAELDSMVPLLEAPVPSACLVFVAEKLDGRSRFTKVAKKLDVMIEALPLKGGAVRYFAVREAKARGHALDGDAADALVDAIGADLAALDDALERLSLYVGEGQPIAIEAVEASVARIRVESIWALVDAVSMRDTRTVLRTASSLLADREPPLRILALVARQLRTVAKMREALASGLREPEAAKMAGAPPFKARELKEAARRFTMPTLRQAFVVLAEADVALKGSKRPPNLVLEEALLRLCS